MNGIELSGIELTQAGWFLVWVAGWAWVAMMFLYTPRRRRKVPR